MIQKFVCLDTETGGFDPEKHSLLELFKGLFSVMVKERSGYELD